MQLLMATGAPETPMPTMTVDPAVVTPGLAGFVAIAVVAIAVVLLLIDMLRRIRRGRYRAQIAEELDAEEQARAAEEAAEVERAAGAVDDGGDDRAGGSDAKP